MHNVQLGSLRSRDQLQNSQKGQDWFKCFLHHFAALKVSDDCLQPFTWQLCVFHSNSNKCQFLCVARRCLLYGPSSSLMSCPWMVSVVIGALTLDYCPHLNVILLSTPAPAVLYWCCCLTMAHCSCSCWRSHPWIPTWGLICQVVLPVGCCYHTNTSGLVSRCSSNLQPELCLTSLHQSKFVWEPKFVGNCLSKTFQKTCWCSVVSHFLLGIHNAKERVAELVSTLVDAAATCILVAEQRWDCVLYCMLDQKYKINVCILKASQVV